MQIDQINHHHIETEGEMESSDCGAFEVSMLGALHVRSALHVRTTDRGVGRGQKTSHAISTKTAQGIMDAALYAVLAGMPFNRFVTIHWEAARVTGDLWATARFLKLASDWVRSRGGVLAFVWVRESGPMKGRHVHILMHLPPELGRGFGRRQRGWLQACGAAWRRGVVKTRPIGRSSRQALGGGRDFEENLMISLDYVLKGSDSQARDALKLIRREQGGAVVGKRCGFSQNIGPKARLGLISGDLGGEYLLGKPSADVGLLGR